MLTGKCSMSVLLLNKILIALIMGAHAGFVPFKQQALAQQQQQEEPQQRQQHLPVIHKATPFKNAVASVANASISHIPIGNRDSNSTRSRNRGFHKSNHSYDSFRALEAAAARVGAGRALDFKSKIMNALSSTVGSTTASAPPPSSSSLSPLSFTFNTLQTLRWRKRHRKRNSNWYDYTNYNENSTLLEWSNPCDGFYDANAKQTLFKPTKREKLQAYYKLKRTASNDYKTLMSSPLKEIDIDNIQIWSLHNYTYKFLPKLKMNSGIALNRWYRNMQTYVGSFGYLRRIQRKWERTKSRTESGTALELTILLKSSRNVLCELETTVNNTQAFKMRRQHKYLPQISREQMEKRLKLRTKQWMERHPNDIQEADSIDLKFVKYYYYEYLRNMWKLLKEFLKRNDRRMNRKMPRNRNRLQHNEIARSGRRDRLRLKMQTKRNRPNSRNKQKFPNRT